MVSRRHKYDMKHFFRSLKYLWPYRFRIGMAVVCVLFIAALWGGGLGMMLPGSKILLAPEGLHGWAWNTLAQDHLQAVLVQRVAPPDTKAMGQPLSIVIDVISVEHNGGAYKASIRGANWIVGTCDANAIVPVMPINEHGATKPPKIPTTMPEGTILGLPDANSATLVRGDVLARVLAHLHPNYATGLLIRDSATGAIRAVSMSSAHAKTLSHWLGQAAEFIPEPQDYAGRLHMFIGLLVVGLVITFVRGMFTFFQEYLVGTAIWQAIMDLRCENYNVVLHLPTTFFSEKGVSDATSRFISDTGELARGQNTLLGKTLVEPAKAIGSLILALSLSWELTLMAMVGGPPAFWMIRKFGKKMHKASKRALESWSGLLAILGETLIGIRVVKAYTMEGAERRRFFRANRQLLKQQTKMEGLDAATGPVVEALGITAGMVAAGLAGYLVFNYKMDRDVFLTWMVSLFALFDPVRKLAKVSMRFQASDAAAQRVFELQDAPQEKFVPNAPSLPRHSQSIEFRNVCLRYPNTVTDAVKNVSLTIKAGQTVAIVGPNGSGKTTLVSMVTRLLDPTSGKVFIDGMDVSQCSIRSLRRQIGLVTQDTVLFHATIGENISYGLRRPKPEDVIAAAKKAFVDEFVFNLPKAYDTMVGEHGATLSGGQKQRISIARAILRDPAILIFDEAMSQVDSDSERRIHEVMATFVKGRTTLMIAHRFATVLSADQIVVMDKGAIIDVGTHQELLGRCELYGHLYKTQFVDSGG